MAWEPPSGVNVPHEGGELAPTILQLSFDRPDGVNLKRSARGDHKGLRTVNTRAQPADERRVDRYGSRDDEPRIRMHPRPRDARIRACCVL